MNIRKKLLFIIISSSINYHYILIFIIDDCVAASRNRRLTHNIRLDQLHRISVDEKDGELVGKGGESLPTEEVNTFVADLN